MRGAQKRDASRVNTHRITPTYAGRTVTIGAVTASVSNHHHVCEEHIKYVYKSPSRLGTSPHMRRSPQNRTDDVRCSRIIPTYAGNTGGGIVPHVAARDHPCVCGEHEQYLIACSTVPGSPPRMQGALERVPRLPYTRRIIPAYAGSTYRGCQPIFLGEHPRLCGEHMMLSSSSTFVIGIPLHIRGARIMNHQNHMSAGASPRMRGALQSYQRQCSIDRIIPAYAGSTGSTLLGFDDTGGSPPRMRGTPHVFLEGERERDHPRACGEH